MSEQIDRLRALCLALPGTSERLSHGEPCFFAGTTVKSARMFVMVDDHHHRNARHGFWCAAPEGVQAEMIDEDPNRFHRPPYLGSRGWLGVYLDTDRVDWVEIEAIVREAYRTIAPASLVASLPA